MSNAELQADPSAPKVLLFGHAGAGKSSLLAALVRAGELQTETLRGDVQEPTGRLAAVRDAVYRGAELARSDTEVTSYTVRIHSPAESASFILFDCSGRAAEGLIRHPSSLHDADTQAPIARAVVEADAILLLVDSTSNDEQLQDAFEEFETFLTVVAQGKASAREVGGFPVLLVLTKCDELARKGEMRAKWEARVHERAERAWRQFDSFLKDAEPHDGIPSPYLPFGSIDLSVHAVAIRLPALADVQPNLDAPYRVAELFRDCFLDARRHRERATISNRRLTWTVRAAVTLAAVLFFGALSVVSFPPERGDPALAERIESYREHEPVASVRLDDRNLLRNKRLLASYRDDAAFVLLPADLQDFVVRRLQEIDEYQAYRGKLAAAMSPGDTRTLEDLQKVEQALTGGELALPSLAWEATPAGQLREKWLADARALRGAEQKFLEHYQDLLRRVTALTLASSFGGNWRADVGAVKDEGAKPPGNLDEPLPDSPMLDQTRGRAVLYRVPYEFERVYEARRDWNFALARLTRMRDLADALALTDGPERPEASLVLPEPGRGVNSATLPGSRLFALRHLQVDSDEFREWVLANFPDPGRSVLAERLERSFQTGVRHVQSLLAARIGENAEAKDTPDDWKSLADSLIDPAFADWGRLLHLMLRLRDPNAANPVAELAAFLRAGQFELDLRGFDLVIPPDLALDKVAPSGSLIITMTPKGKPAESLRFKQSGQGLRVDSGTRYTFLPEESGKLVYRPGEELRAELPVRSGNQEFKLAWESGRTKTYQFDRLAREPRLVKSTGNEAATGVRLTPSAGSALPRLPALFPEVKK
jgi:hypothetical protein